MTQPVNQGMGGNRTRWDNEIDHGELRYGMAKTREPQ